MRKGPTLAVSWFHAFRFFARLRGAAEDRLIAAFRAGVDVVAVTTSFSVNDVPPIAAAAGTKVLHARCKPLKDASIQINLAHLHCLAFRADHRHLCSLWHRLRLLRTPDRLGEPERLRSGLC